MSDISVENALVEAFGNVVDKIHILIPSYGGIQDTRRLFLARIPALFQDVCSTPDSCSAVAVLFV